MCTYCVRLDVRARTTHRFNYFRTSRVHFSVHAGLCLLTAPCSSFTHMRARAQFSLNVDDGSAPPFEIFHPLPHSINHHSPFDARQFVSRANDQQPSLLSPLTPLPHPPLTGCQKASCTQTTYRHGHRMSNPLRALICTHAASADLGCQISGAT